MNEVAARLAGPDDLADAVEVWRLANVERGKPPDPARVARVHAKLADPTAVVVVAVTASTACLGMALAEPGRGDDGAGVVVPWLCHVSMVFVHPAHWGNGVGRLLLDRLAGEARRRGHARLQLWTGERNHRAQRLYARAGFEPTGRTTRHGDESILQLVRDLAS